MRHPVTRRRTGLLSAAVFALLTLGVWAVAGPVQLGGPATYVMTSGASMEPAFHTGDLAVVRRSDSYGVGDIIAYRLTARSLVLHRIVARENERFVTKGDNNAWLDSAKPDPTQVAGRLWIHVPGLGRLLPWLHAPATLAGLIAVAGIAGIAGKRDRRQQAERRGERPMNNGGSSSNNRVQRPADDVLVIAIVVALASLALAVFAFARPLHVMGTRHVDYEQSGTFNYSAFAPGGIYADNQVASGDPVFLALLRNLDVRFDYRFGSAAPHVLHGTHGLKVEIAQDSGWRRTIELAPETAFAGDQVVMTGRVPLMDLQALAAAFGNQTGIKGGNFTVALLPAVRVQGTLAGGALDEEYAPRLRFRMEPTQIVLDRSGDKTDPLHQSMIGVAARQRLETNVFALLGFRLSVGSVRALSLLVFLLAGGVAAYLARPAFAAVRAGEPARIQAHHGEMILNVYGKAPARAPKRRRIDVLAFDDLVRVAEQQGRMIMHTHAAGVHDYFVADGEMVYHYGISPRSAHQPVQEGTERYGA